MATRVTNYFTANGRIRAERTAGFPGHDYIPDGLGNVSATASPTTQDLQYFARYLPYGREYNVQTTNTMPAFRWVGALGYRTTGRRHADEQLGARRLSLADGRWTAQNSSDAIPQGYVFAGGNPVGEPVLPGPCNGQIHSTLFPDYSFCLHCGSVEYAVLFKLDKGCNGWLIQHITVDYFYSDCYGNWIPPILPCTWEAMLGGSEEWWEAWRVVDGVVQNPSGSAYYSDLWTDPDQGRCTMGGEISNGYLKLLTAVDPRKWGWRADPDGCWGELLGSFNPPPGWVDPPEAQHWMITSYACCGQPCRSPVGAYQPTMALTDHSALAPYKGSC